ncbi:MAG: GNAT family N-acetyltransferase [Verrucomicrobiota bacterium]
MNGPVQLVEIPRTPAGVSRFLKVSYGIYGDDPNWVAPLLVDLEKVFTNANPLFQHAEMKLWVAVRQGKDVGRIAGIVDRHYNEYHKVAAAFFGFFESINDAAVSQPLFQAAIAWARQHGATTMLGPMNPTTNDECGLLVKGYDSPPVFMMTYNPPYYAELIEAQGFAKTKDLLAFYFDLKNTPMERFNRLAAKFAKREPQIKIRPILRKNLEADLGKIKEVYNEAWQENWGFVPMTDLELNFMASRLKPMLKEGISYLAELPGETVGFLLALPDFNQAMKPLRGHLITPHIFSFIPYLLGWKETNIVRVITLGVKNKYRGRGIEAAMLADGLRQGFKLGFKFVEASWILEDNIAVQRVIELFGGYPYKTYRIYEKTIH